MSRNSLRFPAEAVVNGRIGNARVHAKIRAIASDLADTAPVTMSPALAAMVKPATPKKRRVPAAPSVLEEAFALQVRAEQLPEPVREFRFTPRRRWRLDFAWPEQRIAVEVEGGIHSGGRHTRADGFDADARKYLAAMLAGWRVVRVTGAMVRDGSAIEATRELLRRSGEVC